MSSYDEVVAANITAARARRKLSQKAVAERMDALGYGWRQQIVAAAENGRRKITVGEVFGLALALETSVMSLLESPRDDGPVQLPSGAEVLFLTMHELFWGGTEHGVRWDGNVPRFPTEEPSQGWTLSYTNPIPPPKVRRTIPNRPRYPKSGDDE
jgi:transcriptional regulator with XRE-family HTH domain